MSPKDDPETAELRKEIESILENLKNTQKSVADATIDTVCGDLPDVAKPKIVCKRALKGHIHKVNAVAFSGDSRHLVSGSLDGKLIVWDCITGNKIQIIPLKSAWVMTATFAKSGNYVASGGMDNMATVFDLNNRDGGGTPKILRELAGYDGFLSCCKFLSDTQVLTGSGDMKICQWDLKTGRRILELYGHAGDVVSMSLKPDDDNMLITGSVDKMAKLWDLRMKESCQTFWGHTADVNSVFFHQSGTAFATCSEDTSARLFDLRSDQQVAQYSTNKDSGEDSGFTSCVLSKSGRFLLAGGDDSNIHIWDALKKSYLGSYSGHENRITSLAITDDGIAVATASWDENVRVWL